MKDNITLQQRALKVLDELIGEDDEVREPENREFLCTQARSPDWNELPAKWAPDWCEGWAFNVPHAAASCFGIVLIERGEVIGHYVIPVDHYVPLGSWQDKRKFKFHPKILDADNNEIATPVEPRKHFAADPVRKDNGEIKLREDGFTTALPLSKRWLVWGQTSNFAFSEGYTFYPASTKKGDTWGEQSPEFAIQIKSAKAVSPAIKDNPRDAGNVVFYELRREDNYQPRRHASLSQDDFIRFLITGETEWSS